MSGDSASVAMTGVRKHFGATAALDGVDFSAYRGRINAIIGENGAGKSTLMNILFGLLRPDSGSIEIEGKKVEGAYSPRQAIERGVGMLQQHFSLVPAFTALENIVLGCEPVAGPVIDTDSARAAIESITGELGGGLDLDRPIERMSVSERQKVEIARMLYAQARILIFDEPTASLAPQEIDNLYRLLRSLADEGKAIILITHRLKEVLKHADSATVLRRGKVTARLERGGMDEESMIAAIVPEAKMESGGPAVELPRIDDSYPALLELDGVGCTDAEGRLALEGVAFALRRGEILGVAGVTGSGQLELAEAMIGLRPPAAGRIVFDGEDVGALDVAERRRRGIVYIPEDRFAQGVIPRFSLVLNRLLGDHRKREFRSAGTYRSDVLRDDVRDKIARYGIDAGDPEEPLASLSGGNQQKLMTARELDRLPKLIIAHGPTRGLDVVASRRCYSQLLDLARAGAAVLLISTELSDLLSYTHRIAVVYHGRLIDAGPSVELDARKVGLLMTRGDAA